MLIFRTSQSKSNDGIIKFNHKYNTTSHQLNVNNSKSRVLKLLFLSDAFYLWNKHYKERKRIYSRVSKNKVMQLAYLQWRSRLKRSQHRYFISRSTGEIVPISKYKSYIKNKVEWKCFITGKDIICDINNFNVNNFVIPEQLEYCKIALQNNQKFAKEFIDYTESFRLYVSHLINKSENLIIQTLRDQQ
jgi:hypothetical protein